MVGISRKHLRGYMILIACILLLLNLPTKALSKRMTHVDKSNQKSCSILSLQKAFILAIRNNPLLEAQIEQENAAVYDVESARSLFLPKVDMRETYARSDSPVQVFSSKLSQESFKGEDFQIDRLNHPSARTNLKTEVIVTQPIFNRGQEIFRYKTAKLLKEMNRLKVNQVKQQVLLSVQKAFTNWLLAIEKYKVIKKMVETARESLRLAKSRYNKGAALKSDVLRYEVRLAGYRRELASARNDIDIAISALNLAMGVPPETRWIPESSNDDSINPGTFHQWISLTKRNRPELLYYKLNTEMARWCVKRTKMNFLPSLNFKGIYEHNTEGIGEASGDAFTLLGTAELNVFNGLGDRSEYKKASAQLRSAEAYERKVQQEIMHQVQKAWLNLQTAKLQIEVTKKAVAQASESLRIIRNRYRNGLTIVTELLDTETALLDANLQHLKALYDYKLAWAEMKWAAGILKENQERKKQ